MDDFAYSDENDERTLEELEEEENEDELES